MLHIECPECRYEVEFWFTRQPTKCPGCGVELSIVLEVIKKS